MQFTVGLKLKGKAAESSWMQKARSSPP